MDRSLVACLDSAMDHGRDADRAGGAPDAADLIFLEIAMPSDFSKGRTKTLWPAM